MKSVRFNFLLILFLIFGLSYQGYADCPPFVKSNTWFEAILSGNWVKEIKVIAIKDQGINGYFNPKIRVCAYDGKSYCYDLQSGESCRQIYGTQSTGAGVSAAAFVDWEGDKTFVGAKIGKGLEWEWAEGVISSDTSDEEKESLARLPKICACSQKGACRSGFAKFWDFGATDYSNLCDTCYQTKVKCAPVPLAPSPPPFCEQLTMSPPKVKIVPITNKDNDYFDPKVKVIVSDLIIEDGKIGKELDFPRKYKGDKAEELSTTDEIKKHSISDKDGTTYYFTTYREKGKLCAEYYGTQGIDKKNLQFVRCFPAPPAPEPEVVEIVQSNMQGEQSNTLKIRMKMGRKNCMRQVNKKYKDGFCTFDVNTNSTTNIGPLSLTVIKPAIVAKTTNSNNNKSNIGNIIEGILESNPHQFKVLKKYGYVPGTREECEELNTEGKCKLDNLGHPKVKVEYEKNIKSKMLCLSGWKPEPEEYILQRENKIIPLKLMGTKYIKHNAVYSKESNQFYYLPSKEKETVNLLQKPQEKLDRIIFNRQGYVFFPDKNKQKKGECSYCVNQNNKIDEAFASGKGLKIVYKLMDEKHEEKNCNQDDYGCICINGTCSRSTQYLNKKDNNPFYLKYEEVDCKDENTNEVQKCMQLKDQLVKVDRAEVFYADKLCKFDLESSKKRLEEVTKKQLKQELEKKSERFYDPKNQDIYTDDLSIMFDSIEIEAWGSGEAGHIAGKSINCNHVCSTKSRAGMPGDYIKAKLRIDPDYPLIKIRAIEKESNNGNRILDKDMGSISIEMCSLNKQDCEKLITVVAGGSKYRTYNPENISYKKTVIHKENLRLEGRITTANTLKSIQDNQIAYIENGEIKYKTVSCTDNFRSSTPGAGGCIDKSKGIYSKGSPGYVKIKPIIEKLDKKEINDTIEKAIKDIKDLYNLEAVTNFSAGSLNVNIREKIEEEVKKELLGL